MVVEKIEDIPKDVFPPLIKKKTCWLSMDSGFHSRI
jgi:hypothetical protein